jgi:hypothetical protein
MWEVPEERADPGAQKCLGRPVGPLARLRGGEPVATPVVGLRASLDQSRRGEPGDEL